MRRLPDPPQGFGMSEEHELLRQEARRLLEERCPFSEVRRLAEDPLGHDPELWKELGALGWTGLVVPEADGGAGLGHLHLALLLEEMGRALLPSPFFASLLAGFALDAADAEQRARWLPGVASGERIASVALHEPGSGGDPTAVHAQAAAAEGGLVLRGVKPLVQAGESADLVIAPFRVADGTLALFAVDLPRDGVRVEREVGIDPTRRTARLVFDGARVGADARLPGDAGDCLRRLALRGAAALAAEMVGGAEATLGITRDYAIQRKQFGKQIGAFQAVKHPLVDVMVQLELARTHALNAAAILDAQPEAAELPVRMAKALASEAFPFAADRGVQLHGGYGFTWDCDVHFYLKRALWSRATLGDAVHHRARLAAALFGELAAPA